MRNAYYVRDRGGGYFTLICGERITHYALRITHYALRITHWKRSITMNEQYKPQQIEPRWQKSWLESRMYFVEPDPSKPKFYALVMYPYPSGDLHMGHMRNYTIGDLVARYRTMQGYNVMNPMGWDAFGLPAENAAISEGIHPAVRTLDNIAAMKDQFYKMGIVFD